MGVRLSVEPLPGPNLWHGRLNADVRLEVHKRLDPITARAMRCTSRMDARTPEGDPLHVIYERIRVPIPGWGRPPFKWVLSPRDLFNELSFYYGYTPQCNAAICHSKLFWIHAHSLRNSSNLFLMAVHGNQAHIIRAFLGSLPWEVWPRDWLESTGYWAVHVALADSDHSIALRVLLDTGLDSAVVHVLRDDHATGRSFQWIHTAHRNWRLVAQTGANPSETAIREGRGLWGALGRQCHVF